MKRNLTLILAVCALAGCQSGSSPEAAAPSPAPPAGEKQTTVNAGNDPVPAANPSTGDGSEGIRSVSPSTPGER